MLIKSLKFLKIFLIIFFMSFILNYWHFLFLYLKIIFIYFLNKYNGDYFFIKNNIYTILYLHLNLCLILKINNKIKFYLLPFCYILIQIFSIVIFYLFGYNFKLYISYDLLVRIKDSLIPYMYLTYILAWLYMRLNNLNYTSIYRKKFHHLIILFCYFFIFFDPIILFDVYVFSIVFVITPVFEFYFWTIFWPICRLCYLSGLLLTIICFDMFNESGSKKKHVLVITILCIYIYIKCFIIYGKKKCQIL